MGYARVAGHGYAAALDIAGWPPGDIVVDAHFQMMLPDRSQPAALQALYGASGERMTGPGVVEGGGGFRAAIASTVAGRP